MFLVCWYRMKPLVYQTPFRQSSLLCIILLYFCALFASFFPKKLSLRRKSDVQGTRIGNGSGKERETTGWVISGLAKSGVHALFSLTETDCGALFSASRFIRRCSHFPSTSPSVIWDSSPLIIHVFILHCAFWSRLGARIP